MTHRQYRQTRQPTTLDELEGRVPSTHIEGAKFASEAFRQAGIEHVLVGGLAVGINGYPRPTKDIDFLVSDNAFEFHGPVVTHRHGLPISYKGVGIDWVSLEPQEQAAFEKFLKMPSPGEVPSIPIEPLVAMKLLAARHKDQTDIVEMIKAGADIKSCSAFVQHYFPSKIPLLNRLVEEALSEE